LGQGRRYLLPYFSLEYNNTYIVNVKRSITTKADRFNHKYYSSGVYENYLSDTNNQNQELATNLIVKTNLSPKDLVLDVGCGFGGLLIHFRNQGHSSFGTEVSKFALDHTLIPGFLIQADANHLPFQDLSFTLVTCIQVLYYFPQKTQYQIIKELARVSNKFIFLDTISKDTMNASQSENPDPVRNQGFLLTKLTTSNMMASLHLNFVDPIETDSINPDFHGLYQKK
jgi:ubiquinone/menaquinone biosynthesis C-methylase UbiE